MATCRCCGLVGHLTRVDGGDMHLDCWMEHHSDPTGAWPPNHECTPTPAPAGVSAAPTSRDSHAEDPAGAPKPEGTQQI